uniref:DUF4347 domain-containing protein n=1 Tax=Spirulina sp. CCY15215 TaxID=2767591 RepID=UPI00195091AE
DANLANANTGDLIVTGEVQGENVNLAAINPIQPQEPTLIRTGDGTQHSPTVMRFGEKVGDSWDYTFIDERADNPYELLYGGEAGTVSRLVLRGEDGMAKITEVLNFANDPIETLSIVAEGNSGEFWLGKDFITAQNIQQYRTQLESWGESLSPLADILLYSCFTALGEVGESLVNQIANATGADVAASVDATGSANYGGNWTLEYSTGSIEALTTFSDLTLSVWDGKLANQNVTNLNDSGAGSLRDALALVGNGFTVTFNLTGTITLASTISWTHTGVTIDGNGSTVQGNNMFQIFNSAAVTETTTIQNLTISRGSAAGSGGGLYAKSNITLTNSTVSGNSASDSGGGLYAKNSNITLINSTVSGNSAGNSGGGLRADNGNITSTNSIVSGNRASLNSGGLNANNITLTNSTVSSNSAGNDGGGMRADNDITLTNSTIAFNVADADNDSSGDGGGLFASNNITLVGSTVSGNSGGVNGGGMRASNGNITLTNSTVIGNSASNNSGGLNANNNITLTSSIVSGNSAGNDGGGMRASNITLTNSTVSGNSANASGGGLYADNITLTNSTVSGNSAGYNSGGLNANNNIALTNSTVSGNSAGNDGGGMRANNITLTNSTIAFNVADANNNGNGNGGGLFANSNTSTIENSIIAQNSDLGGQAPDLSGTFDTIQFSLIQNTTGAIITTDTSNIKGIDPLLLPLANNGGSTQTHALNA